MKTIFTHLKPDIWQYKTAYALRKKRIRIISISLLSFDRKMFNKAFDEIISLNLPNLKPKTLFKHFIINPLKFPRFFYKILTIKADAAICQGAPHYLAAFFIRIFKNRCKRIYFPYDMISSRLKNPKGIFPIREIWGERYSFENCDALINKTSEKEFELLPKDFNIKSKPKLTFPCYAFTDWFVSYKKKEKLSYLDKEIHIVYTGSIIEADFYKSMTKDFHDILNQKIHLHIYCAVSDINEKRINKIIKNNKELERYLHLYPYIAPEKLTKEISKYDFGLHWTGLTKHAKTRAVKFATGNKIASYFEASLPIIVKEENWITVDMIKKYKVGIILKDFNNLKKQINFVNYSSLIKNIEKFRKQYSVEKNIDSLINFIEFVI